MKIVLVELVNMKTLLCRIDGEYMFSPGRDDFIEVQDPIQVVPFSDPGTGRVGFQAAKYFADTVILNKSNVVAYVYEDDIDRGLLNLYHRAVSGIEIADASILS